MGLEEQLCKGLVLITEEAMETSMKELPGELLLEWPDSTANGVIVVLREECPAQPVDPDVLWEQTTGLLKKVQAVLLKKKMSACIRFCRRFIHH